MATNGGEDLVYHEVKATGLGAAWWLVVFAGICVVLIAVMRKRAR